jgi:hypothetical protein
MRTPRAEEPTTIIPGNFRHPVSGLPDDRREYYSIPSSATVVRNLTKMFSTPHESDPNN